MSSRNVWAVLLRLNHAGSSCKPRRPPRLCTSIDGLFLTNRSAKSPSDGPGGGEEARSHHDLPIHKVPGTWLKSTGKKSATGDDYLPLGSEEELDTVNGDHEIDTKHWQDIAVSIMGPMGGFKYERNFRTAGHRALVLACGCGNVVRVESLVLSILTFHLRMSATLSQLLAGCVGAQPFHELHSDRGYSRL